jgi:hypothetical protein
VRRALQRANLRHSVDTHVSVCLRNSHAQACICVPQKKIEIWEDNLDMLLELIRLIRVIISICFCKVMRCVSHTVPSRDTCIVLIPGCTWHGPDVHPPPKVFPTHPTVAPGTALGGGMYLRLKQTNKQRWQTNKNKNEKIKQQQRETQLLLVRLATKPIGNH